MVADLGVPPRLMGLGLPAELRKVVPGFLAGLFVLLARTRAGPLPRIYGHSRRAGENLGKAPRDPVEHAVVSDWGVTSSVFP